MYSVLEKLYIEKFCICDVDSSICHVDSRFVVFRLRESWFYGSSGESGSSAG